MSIFEDFSFSPADFAGTTRLFPLPNLVLFPHVMQPLHVFEPRYRDLLQEALARDRLITMVLLEPGWEKDYEKRPPVYPMGCLGRIAVHHRLEGGAANVLLFGICRVRVLCELSTRKAFREAQVQLCEDESSPQDIACGPVLQRRLRDAFFRILPHLPQAQEQLDHVLGSDVSLGALTDIISYLLDIGLAEKESLLAEVNVRRRAERLLECLADVASGRRLSGSGTGDMLPDFSVN